MFYRRKDCLKGNRCTRLRFSRLRGSYKRPEEEESEDDEEMSMYGFTSLLTIPLQSGAFFLVHLVRREQKMVVSYEAMNVVVQHLLECNLKRILVSMKKLV